MADFTVNNMGSHPLAILFFVYIISLILAFMVGATATVLVMAPYAVEVSVRANLPIRMLYYLVMYAGGASYASPIALQ